MTKIKKVWLTITIILAIIVVLASTMAGLYFASDPYRGTISQIKEVKNINDSMTLQEAKLDLAYVFDKVKDRHYSAKKHVPQAFSDAYAREVAALKDSSTVGEILSASKRLMATLHDAHSNVKYYALKNYLHNQVIKVDNQGEITVILNGVECIVKEVNGINIADLIELAKGAISHENEFGLYENLQLALMTAEGMHSLGMQLVTDKLTLKYVQSSQEITENFDYTLTEYTINNNSDTLTYEIDEDISLATVKIDLCLNNEDYIMKIKEFFIAVKDNNIKNIVIDLSDSVGGNSLFINEFLKYIKIDKYLWFGSKVRYGAYNFENRVASVANHYDKNLAFNGKIFTVTSRRTFSTGKMFATILHDNDLSKIVGESVGNSPSSYGDVLQFQLPSSKLILTTTYKYFIRPNADNMCNTITPDYPSVAPIETIKGLIKEQL